MDVLSDVVTAMRAGRPHSARTLKEGAWVTRHQPVAGAGFHVVIQGSCLVIPQGGDPIRLGVGDVLCVLPHASEYDLLDAQATSALLLCGAYLLDRSRPHPLLAELPGFIHLRARVGSHISLRAAIDLLGSELEQPRPGADAVVPALLDALLLYILRAWYDEQADHHHASGWAAALADPAISAALSGIHRDPGRTWTVASLGVEAGLSRAAFARRFTALVGQPPLAYLTWWRLTIAARLLRESDTPLAAVAARTGYASEFAFSKAFKREFGTAPGRYRQ